MLLRSASLPECPAPFRSLLAVPAVDLDPVAAAVHHQDTLPRPSDLTEVGPQKSFSMLADSSRSLTAGRPRGGSSSGARSASSLRDPSSGLASKYSLAQLGVFESPLKGLKQHAFRREHPDSLVPPVGYEDSPLFVHAHDRQAGSGAPLPSGLSTAAWKLLDELTIGKRTSVSGCWPNPKRTRLPANRR